VKTAIILQARTTSNRLPGKALLPVAGYPSAILAAFRARNRGGRVILATSDDASDDGLAGETRRHGVEVFRGPLHDVLARYFLAAAGLPEDGIVVRLTADNVVPDGAFVEELVSAFVTGELEYLDVDASESGLPYGLSGEVFSVSALRKAHANAESEEDREHVGPWMRRNCRAGILGRELAGKEDFSHLRCTMDDREDYERMLRLFADVSDPVRVGWRELTRWLADMTDLIGGGFTLGTAQLGMEYGRVNDAGKPSRRDAVDIVRRAIAHGVRTIDTARAYVESEAVLGEALEGLAAKLITKLDVAGLEAGASEIVARQRVEESVETSCRALRSEKLDAVLLHGWEQRRGWRGAVWDRLLEFGDEGRISKLGASVYEPTEAIEALRDPAVEHLQIPMNVLDWRWRAAGVDRAITKRPGVVVHARSAFLQGILLHPAERWPVPGFDSDGCVRTLVRLAKEFGRESVADLCLAYVRSLPWIASVVVGCETIRQLDDNVRLFMQPKLSLDQCAELEATMPRAPEALLNPSMWEKPRPGVAAYAS
jgi:spore coat polysaccharide biosynthesis protein SpsF